MGKINIKDNELVALLPEHLRESKLTSAEKLILGDLLFLYGRDFAKENGFVFRTNQDLMKDTGIKSSSTLYLTLRKLEIKGFINRTGGKRNKASEYRLNMDKINDSTVTEIHSNNENNNRNDSVFNRNETEMDIISSRFERLENLLSTKFDTIIEILQKIQFDNNRNDSVFNRTTDKETESHKESSNNILHIDLSSIRSEGIDHPDNFLKKKIIKEKSKYIKHNDISSITSEEENNILNEMKDNKISGPEVNVVANNENNGMNDNTKNNNIQPLQVPASDTSDTSTVPLSGDDGIGCDGGIGKVVNVGVNSESTAMNGVDTTHTTSEDNTNSTEANTGRLAHGNDTPQHQHYSSARATTKTTKDAAAAVGGGSKKGGAGHNISTSAEQSPTTDEKVDNIAPLDMISAFDDSIERKLWGMLRKRKDILIFRDFSDINGKERIGLSDKAKRIINLTEATLDYDFDGNDTFGMLYNNGNGKFQFIATDCNMTITTWDDGKKTDDNPIPNGVF